jgi:drug/metabolite transporter (DMT)-like permease
VKASHFLQLLLLSTLWGGTFPMMRIASPELGPGVLAMGRIVVATLTLALIMRLLGQRWPWRDWREMTLLALVVVAAPFFLFSQASVWLPAGYVALVNSTGVVYGALISAWFKEDTLTVGKIAGCIFGAVGVGLIVQLGPIQPTPTVLLGTLAASLGAVCFGFSMPMMKRTARRIDPLAIAGPLHLFAIPWIAPMGLSQLPQAQWSTSAVLVVLVLGVLTSSLAFWLQLRILRHVLRAAVRGRLGPSLSGRGTGHRHLPGWRPGAAGRPAGHRHQSIAFPAPRTSMTRNASPRQTRRPRATFGPCAILPAVR